MSIMEKPPVEASARVRRVDGPDIGQTKITPVAHPGGAYAAVLNAAEPHCWELQWGGDSKSLVSVVPDRNCPGMWRLLWPNGDLSDMTNLVRAKDAAAEICDRGPPRLDRRRFNWKKIRDSHHTGISRDCAP